MTKTSVQVMPQALKKEKLVRALLDQEIEKAATRQHSLTERHDIPVDFILYIGDDGQTEQVFKYLNRIQTKERRVMQ